MTISAVQDNDEHIHRPFIAQGPTAQERSSGSAAYPAPTPLPDAADDHAEEDGAWRGPLLVNGTLYLFADYGEVLPVNVADGSLGKPVQLGERIAMPPVIANGVWYFVFENGAIAAFK